MGSFVRAGAALLGSVVLAGCASPFAQRVGYDRRIADAPGTITVAGPRFFSREDLISERARDVLWIDRLITESEDPTKVVFKPELFRELEQISAFALAVGAKFDPAAGLSYRRNAETGEIQQEMNLLKTQFQLEQLRRDLELLRAGLPEQTEPVNSGLGTLGTSSTTPAAPVSASAVDQLKAAIDRLLPALTGRLDTVGKPAAETNATSTPFDDFRDRRGLRDEYRSARNAASLDQLHDAGNARLMRLNFEATVIPVERYLHSLGAVQLKVIPPAAGSRTAALLRDWLEYLNTDSRFRTPDGRISQDRIPAALVAGGRFERVTVGAVELLLPIVIDTFGNEQQPGQILRRSHWADADGADQALFASATGQLSSVDTAGTRAAVGAICTGTSGPAGSDAIERLLLASNDRDLSHAYLMLADKVARHANPQLASPVSGDVGAKLFRAQNYRKQLLAIMEGYPVCDVYRSQFARIPEWKAFRDTGGEATVARVYQVGPREHVQQVSTVARSANSFALAASLAASAPGSGAAADAAASYSRQAMGRASALERAPLVVGYAVGGEEAFGWVIGPRATIDPRGRVEMEQIAKTYDVWVDLSVPGWWAGFELQATSVWAPSPARIASGTLAAREGGQGQRIPVDLVRTLADYDALTDYILGNQERRVMVRNVQGGPVNACSKTVLWVEGENLWRAQNVFVMGTLLKRDAIEITPDMRGILVSVPPIVSPANVNLTRTLSVMTPLGPGSWDSLAYVDNREGGECKGPKPQAAAAAATDAVSIGEVRPSEFGVPAKVQIRVIGENLKKVSSVELQGQPGTVQVTADGKSLTIGFDENSTSSVMTSDNTLLEFFDKDRKSIATRRVRTQRVN